MAEPVHAGAPLQPVDANALPDWMRNTGSQFGVIGDAWKVTANTSMDRGIKFNIGKGWSDGILTEFDDTNIPAPFSLPSNATTQYYMIVSRVNWQEPFTRTFVAIAAGASRALPIQSVDYKRQPGVVADFPVALVQVPGGSTQLGEIVDLRLWVGDGGWMGASSDLVKQYITRPMSTVEIDGAIHRLGLDGVWKVVGHTDEADYTFRSLVMQDDMGVPKANYITVWNMRPGSGDIASTISFFGGEGTIKRAGLYEAVGQVTYPGVSGGLRAANFLVNGTLNRTFTPGAGTVPWQTVPAYWKGYLNVGDKIALQAYQDTLNNMTIPASADLTRWTLHRVGR